jgi:SAM-dependent methyltransferase
MPPRGAERREVPSVDVRMLIRFERTPLSAGSWPALVTRIVERTRPRSVCDLGGGANPALRPEFIARHGLDYDLVDISEEELAKAPDTYTKVVADLAAPTFEPPRDYDLAFSVSVAEHISTPEIFHRNVFRLLAPGGHAFHFFSTLYALPFVANRLLPDSVTERLLSVVQPERGEGGSKFPALYRWCRGPTRRQIARFEHLGFQVVEYVGYFGHGYYDRIPLLQTLEDRVESLLVRRPVPWLTSYASVLLRKTR